MSDRRRGQVAMAAVEVGVRTLRALGLVLLVGAVIVADRPSLAPVDLGLLTLMAAMLVAGEILARGQDRRAEHDRVVAAQLGLDLTATVGSLIVFDIPPGQGAWAVVALPILEGALRQGLLGGIAVWLTATVPAIGWIIAGWAPGDGLAPVIEAAGILLVALGLGLPAGRVADRLIDILDDTDADRAELGRRGRLVAAAADTARALVAADGSQLGSVLVRGTVGLGFPAADVVLVPRNGGQVQLLAEAPDPPGATPPLPELSGPDLARVATLDPPAVFDAEADITIGVLAADGDHVTILRAANRPGPMWPPQREAFEMVVGSGATAMVAGFRNYRIERAGRRLDDARHREPLTGLLDRPGCVAELAITLDRSGPETEVRVIVIDLDRFATINDQHGWAIGDEVLREVGARLRRTSPKRAAVARLDADRFAIVTADRSAGHLAEHLRDVLARPVTTSVGRVAVSISVGLALSGDGGRPDGGRWSPAQMVQEAEARARSRKSATHPDPSLVHRSGIPQRRRVAAAPARAPTPAPRRASAGDS